MSDGDIDPRLVRIALGETEGFEFERFAQEMLSALVGAEFVPLGGVHDDGADGAIEPLFSDQRGQYWQFSVRAGVRTKVRQTIRRLAESGLDPAVLWYCTSQQVEHPAVLQDDLQKEFGLLVQFRDRLYLENQVNHSPQTRAAFHRHLAHRVDYLKVVGGARTVASSSGSVHIKSPDVFVFLQQEVDRRSGNASLLDAVCDSLVLWALEGTDPNSDRFMTVDEIRKTDTRRYSQR